MRIAINRAHYPVTVLGWGRRIGIWLQGCTIHCPQCVARDTWVNDPKREIEIAELVAWCGEVAVDGLEGITISGGEPFEQPEALEHLLAMLRGWTDTMAHPVDYLCYSGMPIRTLRDRHGGILSWLDVIIPEPFAHTLPTRALRGSSNQPIIPLTGLGRRRYAQVGDCHDAEHKRFQVAVDNQSIWFIGIPERDDMDKMAAQCESQGLALNGTSWRA